MSLYSRELFLPPLCVGLRQESIDHEGILFILWQMLNERLTMRQPGKKRQLRFHRPIQW